MSTKKCPRRELLVALVLLVVALGFADFGCSKRVDQGFRFVFATDIHIQPENRAVEGFKKAIAHINGLKPKPDFVITGGDNIDLEENASIERADMLFKLYKQTIKELEMPVYHTIGNHDIVGWAEISVIDSTHPEYGKEMFRKRLGEGTTYRSFDHGNWHFIILDSIEKGDELESHGYINSRQFEWLKQDLKKTGKEQPICIALHIPFISTLLQFHYDTLATPTKDAFVNNGTEVLKLLSDYNVRLVLQGHFHVFEEHRYKDTTYIIGGAVSGQWWEGPWLGHPEGFVIVDVKGDDFNLKYESYGWEAAPSEVEPQKITEN